MKKRTFGWMVCIIVVLFVGCLIAQTQPSNASSQGRTKNYKSVEIQTGDTLWTLAQEYASEEYASVTDYIQEVKKINGFCGDTIYEGNYLLIPYFAD